MRKAFLFLAGSLSLSLTGLALEVTDTAQAEQEAVQNSNAQGHGDLFIIVGALIIVAFVLFLSIKFLVRPGEDHTDHVKHIVTRSNESHL